jgi:hydroxymethylpyrimidine pyrophosphatase-like HAD family hydrolase
VKDIAVCFDLDGTLYNPDILAEEALFEAARDLKALGIKSETAVEEI